MLDMTDKQTNKKKNLFKPTIKDIATIGVMIATIEAVKIALTFLPNVELVTFFIIIFTLFFKEKMVYVIPVFVVIEGIRYGFGIWWIMYLYIWPLLSIATYIFRKQQSLVFWSVFSAIYGLTFGALCSIVYLFIGGFNMAFSWWISGIPFDIIHCVSNFVLCFILFVPVRNVMEKIIKHNLTS